MIFKLLPHSSRKPNHSERMIWIRSFTKRGYWSFLGNVRKRWRALRVCFQKGATALQIAPFPDLQSLREDPRYLEITSIDCSRYKNKLAVH